MDEVGEGIEFSCTMPDYAGQHAEDEPALAERLGITEADLQEAEAYWEGRMDGRDKT